MFSLKLKIKLPDGVQEIIGLSPSLILQTLTIGNSKHIASQTLDEIIKSDLLNRNFNETNKINKESRNCGVNIIKQ